MDSLVSNLSLFDVAEEEPLCFIDYLVIGDKKGAIDYMRRTPFSTVENEVLRAGYSTIGRYSGLPIFIDYVMRQV